MGRAHGLDGSFHVTLPVPRLLEAGRTVEVDGRPARIERVSGTEERPIVRLAGIADREAARALTGRSLTVAAGEAPPLGPDEWYAHQLEGCRVHDGDREVGVVAALRELPSCDVLEVARPGAVDLLVPLVRDAVRAVDVDARRVDVDLRFLGADGE